MIDININRAIHSPKGIQSLMLAALAMPGLAMFANSVSANPKEVFIANTQAPATTQAAIYTPTGASKLASILTKSPSSTKRYLISCYDDGLGGEPVRMRVRVQNATKGSSYYIKATLESQGEKQETVSLKNGPGSYYSNFTTVNQGVGPYILTISKVKKKASQSNNKLKGRAVFKTRQECNNGKTSDNYTGITIPAEIP